MRKRQMALAAAAAPLLVAASWAGVLSAQTIPLTLDQAEASALRNHPQIAAARNSAAAAGQRVTEARSAYYPTVNGEVTGSQALHGSRVGAGLPNDSLLFSRFGEGLQISQLVTDMGRTKNLVANSRLQEQAAVQNTQAVRMDVILGVNRAYFAVLLAEAFVRVAEETLKARQTVADQVNALAKAKLKSLVDVSFAEVNVAEARLLLIRAEDSVKQGYADLARAMGEDRPLAYQVQETNGQPALPATADVLIAQAIQTRPELREQELHVQAAQRFEEAERDLERPNVTVFGVGGGLPYLDQTPRVTPREYEGVAINLEVPLFNGHLFNARRRAAHYQAVAEDQRLRDLRQQVEHDVRNAWFSAFTASRRIPVSEELAKQARQALALAQGRYNLGLSSIVELTQAQLNVTQAEVENVSAKYDYQSAYANLQYTMGVLR